MKITTLTCAFFSPHGGKGGGPRGEDIYFAPYELQKILPHVRSFEMLRDIVCELAHVHDWSWRELALRGLQQRELDTWIKDYALVIAYASQLESLKQSIDLKVIHETGCRADSVCMIEDHI